MVSLIPAALLALSLVNAQPPSGAFLNDDTISGGFRVLLNLYGRCTDDEIIQLSRRLLNGPMPDDDRLRPLLQRVRQLNYFGSLSPMQLPNPNEPLVRHTQADYNERLDAAHTLLNRHLSDSTFLSRIIAIDETPFSDNGQQFIGAYHGHRIILYRLTQPGQSLNAADFIQFMQRLAVRMTELGLNFRPVLLLDNVAFHRTADVSNFISSQNWDVVYNPRLSGSDFMPWDSDGFDLIRRIASPRCHRNHAELHSAIQGAVNTINEEDLLSAIDELPERWQFIIDNNGRRIAFVPPRRHRDRRDAYSLNFTAPCIKADDMATSSCTVHIGEVQYRVDVKYGCHEGTCFAECPNSPGSACTTANEYSNTVASKCYVHNDCNPCWKCITGCDLLFY